MEKLIITPTADGYAVTPGTEVVSTGLEGGASRSRRDIIGANSLVNVSWTVDQDAYTYLNAFFNTITAKGSLPFLMDLFLDKPYLTEHVCKFVPGSWKPIGKVRAFTFTANAQLEVKPLPAVASYDRAFVALYNASRGNTMRYFANVSRIANEVLPRLGQ